MIKKIIYIIASFGFLMRIGALGIRSFKYIFILFISLYITLKILKCFKILILSLESSYTKFKMLFTKGDYDMQFKLGITLDNGLTIYKDDYVSVTVKYKKVMKKHLTGKIIGLRVDNLSIQDDEGYYISIKYYNILDIYKINKED